MTNPKPTLDELVADLRRLAEKRKQELEQELEHDECFACPCNSECDCDCHDEVDPRLLKAEADLKALLDSVKQRP